jgi:excisionase family DNA binding protein
MPDRQGEGAGVTPLKVELPAALVEVVAHRVLELMAEQSPSAPEPWIDVKAASEHIACTPSRLYALSSAGRVPCRRDGSRLLFKRSELDDWIEQGGGRRP